MSTSKSSKLLSCGAYLPRTVVTNKELEAKVDTSDEWIRQRTGIEQRHIAQDDETTSLMAIRAAQQALDNAGLQGSDIDGVIVATATPDLTFPSVAVLVQQNLGAYGGPCFDVQAACAGFIYALTTADSLIQSGQCKRILVIGAEKFSNLIDWEDRTTCVLFGDGAGAVILEAQEETQSGILKTVLRADGTQHDILKTSGGVATTKAAGLIEMEGKAVFRHAVAYMSDVVDEVLAAANVSQNDIDWLVPHQANIRIIEATAKKLNLPMEQVILTVQKHGNTSAASIPLALAEGVNDGRIQPGQLVLMEALGAGLTWGAALVRV